MVYDKYNKKVSIDINEYEEELKKLGVVSTQYKNIIKESNTLWKEYSDILEIYKNLKKNMKWSNKDEKSFDELYKEYRDFQRQRDQEAQKTNRQVPPMQSR